MDDELALLRKAHIEPHYTMLRDIVNAFFPWFLTKRCSLALNASLKGRYLENHSPSYRTYLIS
jgi:hypothetical protein